MPVHLIITKYNFFHYRQQLPHKVSLSPTLSFILTHAGFSPRVNALLHQRNNCSTLQQKLHKIDKVIATHANTVLKFQKSLSETVARDFRPRFILCVTQFDHRSCVLYIFSRIGFRILTNVELNSKIN
jgi:hypothetical protein